MTFLFTDVEGSTRLWEDHPTEMRKALKHHDGILRGAIAEHGGMCSRRRATPSPQPSLQVISQLRDELGDDLHQNALRAGAQWTDRDLVEHAQRLYGLAIAASQAT